VRRIVFIVALTVAVSAFSDLPRAAGQMPPHPRLPECQATDPDLLLPDLVPEVPRDNRNVLMGGRRFLQFTTSIGNIGDGPLLIEGFTISTPEGLRTQGYQVIQRRDGSRCARAAGQFEFHAGHNHWHFERVVGYELRTEDPVTGPLATVGEKASFCLLDLGNVRGYNPTNYPRQLENRSCSSPEGIMGISVGWKDVYERFLPGQSLELDSRSVSVPVGSYYLVNAVDPDGLLWDKDRSNNRAAVEVSVSLRPGPAAPNPNATPAPTPRLSRPNLRPGRDRPPRPTRAPRPTRPPRAGETVAPTQPAAPTPAPASPSPSAAPSPSAPSRPTVARPERPAKPAKPTRAPRPGETIPPTAAPSPSPSPSPGTSPAPGGPSGFTCNEGCLGGLSQFRFTWYDAGGLNMTATVNSASCRAFKPESGMTGEITLYDWYTEDRRNTGYFQSSSFVLDGLKGTTSNGGQIEFSPITGGYRLSFRFPDRPFSRMSDGFDFPVVFDVCLKVGDASLRSRMVCQPKPAGMLCHQG
jgi:hypothetical protein